jgi:hypothetical protein
MLNENLENDLDSDPAAPILKEHGGKYTVIQLDNFLSQYETLDDLYRNDLITCRMMYNEFSGDLEDAYKNKHPRQSHSYPGRTPNRWTCVNANTKAGRAAVGHAECSQRATNGG